MVNGARKAQEEEVQQLREPLLEQGVPAMVDEGSTVSWSQKKMPARWEQQQRFFLNLAKTI